MPLSFTPELQNAAIEFNKIYKDKLESKGTKEREEFVKRFPLDNLPQMTLEQYAIGKGDRNTFCYWQEIGSSTWALTQGTPATRFGIYFGDREKSGERTWRYTKKFCPNLPSERFHEEAYKIIHAKLLQMLQAGQDKDFSAVDKNTFSCMFKAKLLSLYFPHMYLPICSDQLLGKIAAHLGGDSYSRARTQFDARMMKETEPVVKNWSDLKLAQFLIDFFRGYLSAEPGQLSSEAATEVSNIKMDWQPDFEKLQEAARLKGEQSEKFALEYEKKRLRFEHLEHLIPLIVDRTKFPRYGYDFESFTANGLPRFIEVKTHSNGNYFFLSANEIKVAQSESKGPHYYFYLIDYGLDNQPASCTVVRARDMIERADFKPHVFLVDTTKVFGYEE